LAAYGIGGQLFGLASSLSLLSCHPSRERGPGALGPIVRIDGAFDIAGRVRVTQIRSFSGGVPIRV